MLFRSDNISDFFLGDSRDDLPDNTEIKLDQQSQALEKYTEEQNKKLDSIYSELYNITRHSLNKPTPEQIKQIQEFREEQKRMNDILANLTKAPKSTPSPKPVPTPVPTPQPTPDPYKKILEEILENQKKQPTPQPQPTPPPQPREEYRQPRNDYGNPGYQFSHSSSNTSGSFGAPPPLKVYYPIKRNVQRFEGY